MNYDPEKHTTWTPETTELNRKIFHSEMQKTGLFLFRIPKEQYEQKFREWAASWDAT